MRRCWAESGVGLLTRRRSIQKFSAFKAAWMRVIPRRNYEEGESSWQSAAGCVAYLHRANREWLPGCDRNRAKASNMLGLSARREIRYRDIPSEFCLRTATGAAQKIAFGNRFGLSAEAVRMSGNDQQQGLQHSAPTPAGPGTQPTSKMKDGTGRSGVLRQQPTGTRKQN